MQKAYWFNLASVVVVVVILLEVGLLLAKTPIQGRVYGQDTSLHEEKIAFVVYDVYSINADGSNIAQLTDVKPGPSEYPTWSPDGTQIAFDAQIEVVEASGEPLRQIFVVNTETLAVKKLNTDAKPAFFPVWSPVEDKIAFILWDQNQAIYLMDADGSNQTKLIEIEGDISGLTWSSDGKRIAFAADSGLDTHIYTFDVAEALAGNGEIQPTNLTEEIRICQGLTSYFHPVWSPIDSQIAVIVDCGTSTDIYLLNLDTSLPKVLSYDNITQGDVEKTGLINPLAGLGWSPDGQKIAFVSQFGSNNSEIRFIDLDEGPENLSITQVTTSGSQPGYLHPAWRPGTETNSIRASQ